MDVRREARFWIAGAVVFGFLLWLLHGILLPFVAGMAIAYFLDPVADRMEAMGLSRRWAVTLITLFFLLVGIVLTILIIPLLLTQTLALVRQAPHILEVLRHWIEHVSQGRLDNIASMVSGDEMQKALKGAMGPAMKMLGSIWNQGMAVIGLMSLLLVTPIVAIYLLLDWDRMVARIDELLPREHAGDIRAIFRDVDTTLAGFVRGQVTVCLLLGAFYAIGLTVAGLQFGLVVGLGAGLITFIPYMGPTIGGGTALLLALFQFWPDYTHIGIIAAIFVVGQVLEGNLLTPKLVGNRVRLHPVWIMFALFAFGYVFGFVGMLIAVPVTAAIGVLIRHGVAEYEKSRVYLGDDRGERQAPGSEPE